MKATCKKMTALLGMLLAGALLTATAAAQCTSVLPPEGAAKYHKQSWRPGDSGARLQLAADTRDSIVGMWVEDFISEGNDGIPDGTVIDIGLTQWHPDGTEFTNSMLRSPGSSAVCQGVWEKLEDGSYKLNHFAISWDPSNTTAPIGPGQIIENITLDKDGNGFCGKFSITQFDMSGNELAHIQGKLKGHRITVETHAKQLL